MSSGGHLSVCRSTAAGFCGVLECADDESSGGSGHDRALLCASSPNTLGFRTVETGTRTRQATGRRLVEHPPQRGEIEYNSQFMEGMLIQAEQAPATHEQEEEPFPGSRARCDEAARGRPGRRLLAEEPQRISPNFPVPPPPLDSVEGVLLASRSTFD
ncbi:hypothetical protein CFC21_032487 [Triticum aestivum]|uniref:Uncharacterized protein n=3 Tax=Triticinae TaxID=1648030 RepID=A0A453DAV9_AEGTS|nr:hypothetical protein CFC21_032487 [Triticum aestivum]